MTSLNLKLRALRKCVPVRYQWKPFYSDMLGWYQVMEVDEKFYKKGKRDKRLADKLQARIEKDFHMIRAELLEAFAMNFDEWVKAWTESHEKD